MPESQDSAGSGSPNLLLVEDDPAFANLLKWVLDGSMNVEVRERAEDVLELVDAGWPNLIVSDLHMPRMTGIELYQLLRGHATGRQLPFALLTGAYEDDKVKAPLPEARAAGIEVILSKDLGLDGLKEHIERFYVDNSGA